jgi:hypothetical protein
MALAYRLLIVNVVGKQFRGGHRTFSSELFQLSVVGARRPGDLETYVSGQSDLIIDYATARRREEPISTATTESTVQWLLHRRMHAQQQMRCPRRRSTER